MSPALPAGEVDPAQAARARERMHELVEGFFGEREDERVAAKVRAGTATPQEREGVARAKAQAILDAPAPDVVDAATYPGGKVPSPCPVGQRAVVRDGLYVCPHCNEPVRDAEGRVQRAEAS